MELALIILLAVFLLIAVRQVGVSGSVSGR